MWRFFFLAPLMGVSVSLSGADTLQETGLPSPIEFEAVISHVVFGTADPFEYSTTIVLVNAESEDARVEFQLFDHEGRNAPELTKQLGISGSRVSEDRTTFLLGARSLVEVRFPILEHNSGQLLNPDGIFSGWVRIRANAELTSFSTLHANESDEFSSVAGTLATETGFLKAQLEKVDCSKSTTDPLGHWLIEIGVSLVNPHDQPVTLWFDSGIAHESLELGPLSKKSLLLSSLNGICDYSAPGRPVLIQSEDDRTFGLSAFELRYRTDLDGRILRIGDNPLLRVSDIPVQQLETSPFDFPVEIADDLEILDLHIFLTEFGFVMQQEGGQVLGLFDTTGGEALFGYPEIGLAVIMGSRTDIPIVFVESRKVIRVRCFIGACQGEVLSVTVHEDEDLVVLRIGSECINHDYVIDLANEELVDAELATFCF